MIRRAGRERKKNLETKKIELETLVVGPLATNCYLLHCGADSDLMIVDPGGNPEMILTRVAAIAPVSVNIFITHGHGDHIEANRELVEQLDCPVLIGEMDAPALTDPSANLSLFLGTPFTSPGASRLLKDNEKIDFNGHRLDVLLTPGHSPGSVCLYSESGDLMICGDVIFHESIGRTDLPGGDFDRLMKSIHERILTLPDSTVLYPGHGPSTTVGHERKNNPFLTNSRFH